MQFAPDGADTNRLASELLLAGQQISGPSLQPFRGLRFQEPSQSRQSVAPSPSGEDAAAHDVELAKRQDPRSVLHLSWSAAPALVPAALQQWLAEGTLTEDGAAQHYVYEYSLAGQRVRGVIGSLDLTGSGMAQRVLLHEGLVESALAGFHRRVDESRLDVEPVLLVQAFSERTRAALQIIATLPPVLELEGPGTDYHRLWAVSSPSLQHELTEGLSATPALLADGHHRYAAHQRTAARPDGPGQVLTMIVDAHEHALALGPIHRIIRGLNPVAVAELLDLRGWFGTIQPLCCTAAQAKDQFELDAEAVFLIGADNRWYLLGGEDSDPGVVQAHSRLFPLLDVVFSDLEYRHAWQGAVELAAVSGGTAVLLKAMSFDQVFSVAQSGRTLPEKATSFSPKPVLATVLSRY